MTEQRYHPVQVHEPSSGAVFHATQTGFRSDLTLDDPNNGVIRTQVEPIACQIRAIASWGGPDMRQHSVALVVESTIPLDLTAIRAVDRFGDGNDLLQDMAHSVQKAVKADVLVHNIDATYATSDLQDRPFILHQTPVQEANGVSHYVTYVGEREPSALNAETNQVAQEVSA